MLRKRSGLDLRYLVSKCSDLDKTDMRLYSYEIISGLESFHVMRIVHLEVKSNNVPIAGSDFSRSINKKSATKVHFLQPF